MAVAVVNSWSGFLANPPGDLTPLPTAASLQIPISNTGATGNWLVAICAWQQPSGFATTIAAGDDGPNLWEPLGAPNGTTPPGGNTRVSIWTSANPRAAGNLFISPNDEVIVLACLVVELSGLTPWQTLAAVPATAFQNSATALGVLSLTPAAQSLLFTALAADLGTVTISGPGAGWTALPTVTANNGFDHTADCTLKSSWQVTSSPVTATWTTSASADLSGLIAGVQVAGTAPAAPSQSWALVRAQVAFGAGVTTPWDQLVWTDLTPRFRAFSGSRGQQYELDTTQTGTSNWTWANNDGALTPGSPAAFAGIDTYNPVRLLVTWPPPPAANARTYVVNRSLMERWPTSLTAARYQNTGGVSTDIWSALTTQLKSLPIAEFLLDKPYIYAPLGDPAGSTTGSNIAPGVGVDLQLVQSKYGAGAAVQAFGVSAPGLVGDTSTTTSSKTGVTTTSSATCWQQTGLITTNQGYTLIAQDPNLPALSGGVTVEGWFNPVAGQPSGNLGLITCKNAKGIFTQVYLDGSGQINIQTVDKFTGAATSHLIASGTDWIGGGWFQIVLEITLTSVTIYVNGGYAVSGPLFVPAQTFAANFASSPYWVSWNGSADQAGTGLMWNGQVAHCAIWGYELVQSRAVTHYIAMLTGVASETTGQRIERLLAAGNCSFPRCVPAGFNKVVGAVDVAGQTVGANVTNIASSAADLLTVNGPGYLVDLARAASWNLPVSWTFGEAVAPPLNQNWSFANGISPWIPFNNSTITPSAIWTYRSPGSLLIVGDGVTANPEAKSEQTIPVTPGVFYTFSPWLDSPQGWASTGVAAGITWFTSGGAAISTTFTTAAPIVAGQPLQVSQTLQAPAGAAFAQAIIRLAGTPPSTVQLLAAQAPFTGPTEYPYLGDFATEHDPSTIANDITLTQLASPTHVIGSTNSGVTIAVSSAGSMAQYGDQTVSNTVYLATAATITDLANWILNTLGTVETRIAVLTLDPAANPALWPIALGLECGQVVQINRRLGSGTEVPPEVTGQYQVMTIAPSTEPGTWKTTISLLPYQGNALTCDDPVRGVLDGLNRLAW